MYREKFEDPKEVIRNRKLKTDITHITIVKGKRTR